MAQLTRLSLNPAQLKAAFESAGAVWGRNRSDAGWRSGELTKGRTAGRLGSVGAAVRLGLRRRSGAQSSGVCSTHRSRLRQRARRASGEIDRLLIDGQPDDRTEGPD